MPSQPRHQVPFELGESTRHRQDQPLCGVVVSEKTTCKRGIRFAEMMPDLYARRRGYFAPFAALKGYSALYLGPVHLEDGVEGARRRIAAADKFVADFGLSTECGFGRRPQETISELLKLHAAV